MKEPDSSGSAMRSAWGCSDQASARDLRNSMVSNVWLAASMAIFLVSLFVMKRFGVNSLALTSGALVVTALGMIPFVRAYVYFLREADELTRLIHLQAMAIGFGVGFGMWILDQFILQVATFFPLPPLPLKLKDIVNPFMAMIAAYAISVVKIGRRYSR